MKTLIFLALIVVAVVVFPAAGLAEDVSPVDTLMAARVEQAKATYPIRLSDKEKSVLAARCKKAQENLAKIKVRLEARESIISKKYELIDLHLSAIQERLSIKQLDTSIVDLLLSNFQKLAKEHQSAFVNYLQSLEDSTTVDCVTDPQGFKALVEDVRTKRQDFVSTINAVKDFSSADLKTSFDALRTRLNTRSE